MENLKTEIKFPLTDLENMLKIKLTFVKNAYPIWNTWFDKVLRQLDENLTQITENTLLSFLDMISLLTMTSIYG